MKRLGVLVIFFVFLSFLSASELNQARSYFLSSSSQSFIIETYSKKAVRSADPVFLAEYGYILSCLGLSELGLYHLDRALIMGYDKKQVKYYFSEVLKMYGIDHAATELNGEKPKWLNRAANCVKDSFNLKYLDKEDFYKKVNSLMLDRRYLEAIVNFSYFCALYNERRCWAGYAISLERAGLYDSAYEAVKKDISLSEEAKHKKLAEEYLEVLKDKKAQSKINKKSLSGRWLFGLNGGYNRYSGNDIYNFSLNGGKFISDSLDINGSVSYDSSIKLGFNVGFRYGYVIKESPVRLSIAGKSSKYGDSKLFFVVSPGLSYFIGAGSFDIFYDKSISGDINSDRFISGYTVYF